MDNIASNLSGIEKVAIIISSMEISNSTKIMKMLSENERIKVTEALMKMEKLDNNAKQVIVNNFLEEVKNSSKI